MLVSLLSDPHRKDGVGDEGCYDLADRAHQEDRGEWYLGFSSILLEGHLLQRFVNDEVDDRIDDEDEVSDNALEECEESLIADKVVDD